jgi:hypothetical protein
MGFGAPTRAPCAPRHNMLLGPTLDLDRGLVTPRGCWAHGANLHMEARPQPALNVRRSRRDLTKCRALTGLWQVSVIAPRITEAHYRMAVSHALNTYSELHALSRPLCHAHGRHHHEAPFGRVMSMLQWTLRLDSTSDCARTYTRQRASLCCNPYQSFHSYADMTGWRRV